MYKRVLLKLSGEALSDNNEIFSATNLEAVAKEIKEVIKNKCEVGLVIGGGNIYRGKIGENLGMDRVNGDSIGMLATIMNAIAMKNTLEKLGVPTVILSAIPVQGIAKEFSVEDANNALKEHKVVIYAGGTGHPYFSTDTCSALRAIETKCDVILSAKNGVDGVYSADPRKDKNAKKYDTISYQEVIEKNLQVMDITAITLCKENKMKLVVFSMNEKGNIIKAVNEEKIGTIVK